MDLKQRIREFPDWPIKGVNFKDITTLLQNKGTFQYVIDQMIKPYRKIKIDKVVAIESRGFLLGAPVAYKLSCGICLVRKPGKLPYKTVKATYQKEYGPDTLAMHKDTITKGDTILLIDDLMATGGTMEAAVSLVKKLGGKIVGISCIIDLPFLGGSKKLKQYKVHSLVSYEHE